MYANVYVTSPDEKDGYYVELVSMPHHVIEWAVWRKTVKECHEWATANGTQDVREL